MSREPLAAAPPAVTADPDFMARRDAARQRISRLESGLPDRSEWFAAVYAAAGGDPAAVPWADLEPKATLVEWLARHPGHGEPAIDVACGLGDNAEAMVAAGYRTTAFDVAAEAIGWARRRFPQSPVDYVAADLFDSPAQWLGAFGLVHECYTVQALRGEMRANAIPAIARFVRPGGFLVMLARFQLEGSEIAGPPWPLTAAEVARFDACGLRRIEERHFTIGEPRRAVPQIFAVFQRA